MPLTPLNDTPVVLPSHSELADSDFAAIAPSLNAFAEALLAAPFRAVGPRTLDRVLDEIVIDSLAPMALGLVPETGLAIDLGCGPGIPLIPLALASPSIQWLGMDSAVKRLTFVNDLCDGLGLPANRVRLSEQRVAMYGNRSMGIRRSVTPSATIQPFLGRYDLVVARGTAPVAEVVAMAAGFLSPAGRILIFATAESAAAGLAAIAVAGWTVEAQAHPYARRGCPDRSYAILEIAAA